MQVQHLGKLIFSLALASAVPTGAHASAACEDIFAIGRSTALGSVYTRAMKRAPLEERIVSLTEAFPKNTKLIEGAQLEFAAEGRKYKGVRNLLVVSLADLPENFRSKYLNAISRGTVSFPLGRGAGHLYTRLGNSVFDQVGSVTKSEYQIPSRTRLEPVVELTPAEESNLRYYVKNAIRNFAQTVGEFQYNGNQKTNGELTNNICVSGGHNCTSWMATAPIGLKGEKLLQLVGMKANQEYGTNPGWWNLYLSTRAKEERVPLVVYWTDKPLEQALAEDLVGNKLTNWDFDTH